MSPPGERLRPGPRGRSGHLFAYGTLEIPEVMRRVSGADHRALAAVLDGHRRRLLRGKTYPGIVEAPGERTEGVLYLDVAAAAWRRLDRFEDALYERLRVTVRAEGLPYRAFAYVVPSRSADLLGDEPWDRETFRHRHLAAFRAEREALRD